MLDIGYLKTIKILQPGLNNCPLHQVGIQDFGKCDSLFNYDCDSHFPGTLPRIAREVPEWAKGFATPLTGLHIG